MTQLDIKTEVAKLQQMYAEDPRQKSFNLLLLGEYGTGKTMLAETCRLPVHIDSFDPGGTKHLQAAIKSGKIVVDARYEAEDPLNPSAYRLWKSEFEKRLKGGYFENFGTYILDSSTTWADAIMNQIMKEASMAGKAPRRNYDYMPHKIEIRNRIRECLLMPCDFILTGHLRADKDEATGRITFEYMTTGQGTVTIPMLFDEIYVAAVEEKAKGLNYYLQTCRNGKYPGRTRIGRGIFEVKEEPNIKALLKKAGYPCEDKPLFA